MKGKKSKCKISDLIFAFKHVINIIDVLFQKSYVKFPWHLDSFYFLWIISSHKILGSIMSTSFGLMLYILHM
jgi:hypothetical protein